MKSFYLRGFNTCRFGPEQIYPRIVVKKDHPHQMSAKNL